MPVDVADMSCPKLLRPEACTGDVVRPQPVKYGGRFSPPSDLVKHSSCLRSCSRGDNDIGSELLDIFLSKSDGGGSFSSLAFTPPCRSSNPLIRDINFVQSNSPSANIFPVSCRVSAAVAPVRRVEGFFSPRVFDSGCPSSSGIL
ncbi:hypothetical protein CLOM_g20641 [Closterium sp. NIES-68]|nr:hypothetical protein CLOM_g20641 [Closterium sp. NIES-68]GJP58319.1 hypothetical protein CLOP_g23196 [Closterium sp. NIES-67]